MTSAESLDTPSTSGPARAGLTLRDFLTDGSLARLCSELSRITGATVEVRDERDRLVTADARGWRIGGEEEGLPRERREIVQPLVVGGATIGAIVAGGDGARRGLSGLLPLITQTAVEWCHGFLELRHAIDELGVLIELSSMLVGASDVSRMVEQALGSVLRVLGLDAGSVVLLREDADGIVSDDERDLHLASARGLSPAWLESPESLSQRRIFDRMALAGEVVSIEDLLADSRVRIQEQVRSEGLRGFMCTGLVFRGRPIGVIRVYSRAPRVFSELDKRLLRSIAQQAAAAVQQSRMIRQRERDLEMERQVRLAADVQRRMLPRALPSDPRVELAARYQPSFQLGGDFYDLFELGGRIAIAVGDVAGKGVPAAMLMSLVRSSFRAHAERALPPAEVLTLVNRDLCRDSLPSEFATIWYGLLDPATGRLEFACAGHEPPVVLRSSGRCEQLPIGGLVAGIDPGAVYEPAHVTLSPGELLLAFTDGVPDVMSFEGQRFGKPRLRRVLESISAEGERPSANAAIGRVLRELRQFGGLTVRQDDTTLVAVAYTAG
ncbi:MAG TPA: GAF domain-containing SpoIIE family protein phosphatase [Phycisphaerales bacterium]|nr:GAF domain-containing SpoIIE family protein phosphatase [Phycisphaerales bacterium]